MDIAQFLRMAFLCNTSGDCFWQRYHSTVKSPGVPVPPRALYLHDFAPPRAFNFNQKLSQNVAQITVYYHVTNNFFLASIDWPRVFDFRICFKNLHKALQSNYVI